MRIAYIFLISSLFFARIVIINALVWNKIYILSGTSSYADFPRGSRTQLLFRGLL